jgi:hypothetical protein
MNGERNRGPGGFTRWATAALLWVTGAGSLFAQTAPVPNTKPTPPSAGMTTGPALPGVSAPADAGLVTAGCSSCSSGLLGGPPTIGGGGCLSCGDGCGGCCTAGREPCDCCIDESTCFGRLVGGMYRCICCPDPCYEPRWNALADSGFYTDGARPMTQMKLRFDHVWDFPFPDKAEFLWAQENGKGPHGPGGIGETATSYRDFVMYNEVAIDRFSMWVSIPYVQMSSDTPFAEASGFGDIAIGTKSLLLDCDLMQFSFGFNTYILSGNFLNGLGTGHVSLEPELMMALKLTPTTYLEASAAYRIPIGGDSGFEGPVLQYHFSLNHLLWSCGSCNGIKLIGDIELNGYEILGGSYTDATGAVLSARSIGSILSVGPGVRLVICDKIDFGIGSAFNITNDSMGDEMIRAEFRWRF